jgi:hypothetical protein
MGHRKTWFTLIALSICTLVADAAEPDFAGQEYGLPFFGIRPESLCGTVDDLQDVERYDGSLGVPVDYAGANNGSTVQLQWLSESAMLARRPDFLPGNVAGQRWCSGTLVSTDRVLTAGHCVQFLNGASDWVTPSPGTGVSVPDEELPGILARLQVVHVNYQRDGTSGRIRVPKTFAIERLVEYSPPEQLDYAIVELSPDRNDKLPGDFVTPAKVAARAPIAGETLAIIQHPQGQPKKIGAGTLSAAEGHHLFYANIDTWGAASGAAVRGADGAVIGVHIRGGCNAQGNSAVSTLAISEVSDAL